MKTLHKRWKLLERINGGGQGTVFSAKDLTTDKIFAVKIFQIKKFQKKKLKRIQTEIEIVKKLNGSTNIVNIYDDNLQEAIDEKSQEIFYVMDYSKYGSLKDNDFFIGDVEASLRIFKEILKGVNSAHKQGVIHRDLKPENVILYPTQKDVLITDFGISLIKEAPADEHVTEEDEVLGPLYFIAPEQYKSPSDADEKSDIYSLGKILLFLLTGKGKIFREEVEDLTILFSGENPYLPLIQENLLSKMVTTDKDKRFNNVEEVIDEVNVILDKVSENSSRYLKKVQKGARFYDFLIGSQRQKFIKEFPSDIFFSIRVLELGLIDLNREKKENTAKRLIEELKATYPDKKFTCPIDSAELFVFNPKKLQELEAGNPECSFPSYFLYKYFFNNQSYSNAHKYIEKALKVEADLKVELDYLFAFSEICKKCHCELEHDFEKRIKKLLQETTEQEEKIKLYRMLGEHYIEVGNVKRGLIFLETYLSDEPFDEDIRFTCAYQYSEINEYPSSLYHYLIAFKNSKDISNVANNLGVLYNSKEMPVKAMDMYEKSFKLGNTLAGSNIAHKYLSIGQKEKALELLRSIIRNNKTYNEQVDSILGSVQKSIDEEEKQEKMLNETGNLISDFHIEYVKAYTSQTLYNWNGFWEINKIYQIEIKEENGKWIINNVGSTGISVTGDFDGNCLNVTKIVLNESSYSSGETHTEGYISLKSNDNFSGYLRRGVLDPIKISGIRIQDIEDYKAKQPKTLSALAEAIAIQAKINKN